MLENYLKVILRNSYKNRYYSILNILGLVLGYASLILVILFLSYETSFENFHKQSDRIYRVAYSYDSGNDYQVKWARVPINYINELIAEFPEVEKLIRFQNHERKYILVKENKFRPDFAYQTDNEVFKVFNFQMIVGNSEVALKEPYSVVLTESIANKYFGKTDILGGDILVLSDWNPEETRYKVTGVIQDLPSNTHLPVDMLFSFNDTDERTGWAYVYILVHENTDIESLQEKIPEFVKKYADESSVNKVEFEFQPLRNIHLHSNLAREIIPNGSIEYVYLFMAIGLFLILIALINYSNLFTAMAMGRMRETGLRKILGAKKGQVFSFLLFESFSFHFISILLAFLLVFLAFPYFQSLTSIDFLINPAWLTIGILIIGLINALITMVYPLIILNKPSPIMSIKPSGQLLTSKFSRGLNLKRMLLTLQYAISILLIGSAFIARDQFKYLNESNLGITREQVLAIPAVPDKVRDSYQSFKEQLLTSTGIESVTACMEVPSREIRDVGPVLIKGINTDPEKAEVMDIQVIDHDYLPTLSIELAGGTNIPQSLESEPMPELTQDFTYMDYLKEKRRAYLINETAMKQLGWQTPEEAIGHEISWSISNIELGFGPITGVVKDYHQETLKNTIDPTIMIYEPIWLRTFLIKINTDNIQETIKTIQTTWDKNFPQYPLEYHFLDEMYENLYKNERVKLELLYILSGLAIFISFTGLLGLIAYSLKTRVKEIAVRKVLGANISALIQLIGKEYILLLAIASIVSIPISYHFVSGWLQQFAYKVDISLVKYAFTILLMGAIILLTVTLQTLRTTMINPADTLREE